MVVPDSKRSRHVNNINTYRRWYTRRFRKLYRALTQNDGHRPQLWSEDEDKLNSGDGLTAVKVKAIEETREDEFRQKQYPVFSRLRAKKPNERMGWSIDEMLKIKIHGR